MAKDRYESPLSSRYASKYMLQLFSAHERIRTWRKLWVELARAEHELGLPITAAQVAELEAHTDDIDFDMAAAREKEVLTLMVKGFINKEIASKLGISLPTVIFHRNNICLKLKTRSIGKMTVYAVLAGIVEINEI